MVRSRAFERCGIIPADPAVLVSACGMLGRLLRCVALVVPCLGVLLIGPTRANAAEQDDLLTGYSVTTWNDGDARPFGAVNAIVQDGRGYLWIGADAGLFRFDGSRFTTADESTMRRSPSVRSRRFALAATERCRSALPMIQPCAAFVTVM